jgi:hypothetical protein
MGDALSTAILIPVLDRPHRVEPLVANIADATPEPHTILFAASDQPTIDELDRLGINYLRDDGDSWPNRINRLFHATTDPYVFLGADDVSFHSGWLSEALKAMAEVDGVVAVSDLFNPYGTLALVSRRYITEESGCVDTPGVVVHGGYRHNYSDTELFSVARARGRHAYCAESIVEHFHPSAGKAPMDGTYQIGFDHEMADRVLYASREPMWNQ